MAAIDTPWIASMSPSSSNPEDGPSHSTPDPNPPTVASFSPSTVSHTSAILKQRSTVLVHQKSPLLIATPPQVTRALAYSHPFLLPLNKLVGLLTWTSGDPWESFLLIAGFWGTVLYGDVLLRWAGPVLLILVVILGMYFRRYSPLSSTSWTGEKQKSHKRETSEMMTKHHKSLDEIVETLRVFTSRCNILLEPLLLLTDFLSAQRTATSATTRPALTKLFLRILLVTPVWIALTLPPVCIITSRRLVLLGGTLLLSWHSRPARVTRLILWRSMTVRRICSTVTGLDFIEVKKTPSTTPPPGKVGPPLPPRNRTHESAFRTSAQSSPQSPGVRFTFILYENQRRWLGVGWTSSLLAYERAAWTDEHLNPAPSKDEFELPEVEGGLAKWRWVEASEWRVEGEDDDTGRGKGTAKGQGAGGWIYYDNKWNDGRRGRDGWGRYTRRRKWYRDAELVEVDGSTDSMLEGTSKPACDSNTSRSEMGSRPSDAPPKYTETAQVITDTSGSTAGKLKGTRRSSKGSETGSGHSGKANVDRCDDHELPDVRGNEWLVGEDAGMSFG